jgi:hypothetical protein
MSIKLLVRSKANIVLVNLNIRIWELELARGVAVSVLCCPL